MGDVHDFKRPPKNEGQFKGYRPELSSVSLDRHPAPRRLGDWQKSLLAWSALVLIAVGIWLLAKLLAA